ncbi:MAG: CRISPR-associated protein Cas6 [Cyclobacteriaceae bacterium]|nr:CRISPR-associated protein Cas6 [Cyclobacteriaceae bacterium]
MRIRIIFQLKNKGAAVPFHHQYLLAQLLKGILIRGGEPSFFDYHWFNFSGLKGQTKVSRSGLHFYSNKVTLVISAFDKTFVDYLLKHLFSFSQIEVGGLMLEPEYVEQENLPPFEESMKYICISPVVLLEPSFNDNQGKRFISPEEDTFSDSLYEATMERMSKMGKFNEEQLKNFFRFQIVPDKKYLQKIKATQKKFARIYPMFDQDVKYEVRGYTLPFTLYAAKEVQEFVFVAGLGKFCHKGFGMLDVTNNDPGKENPRYQIPS